MSKGPPDLGLGNLPHMRAAPAVCEHVVLVKRERGFLSTADPRRWFVLGYFVGAPELATERSAGDLIT
jgi:hypothetical protein